MASTLSEADRKLLRLLVDSEGSVSSNELSRRLRIPSSSIGRARKRLEQAYVSKQYSLDPTKFGWRRVDLLISTDGGKTMSLGKTLLKGKGVTYVARMIGEHTIDLRVEIVVKDYSMLLNIIEEIKATNGIRDVIWTEVVQSIGTKSPSNLVTF
ncbi:MAG: Lrp/AsnC family transcriptional regulator [archaeon]|nr:Lrp/AsnC family transcriptional regulator [archaeon]